MAKIADWSGREIEIGTSAGGVKAVVDPWDNFVRTGISPWPPPELIQKLYQSRQARAFVDIEHSTITSRLGFYSDLQSIHSEDSITWSFFGPPIYAESAARTNFVEELLMLVGVPGSARNARIWLWRRLPHPDTLVPGGPEIDFGIQTDEVFLLGEAKWRSAVGAAQGANREKDQITLRREFCQKYGRRLLPDVRRFGILGVSWKGGMLPHADTEAGDVLLHLRDVTWEALSSIQAHPCAEELRQYLKWKIEHSIAYKLPARPENPRHSRR